MGDKIRAKQTVAAAGVPVVPGSDGTGLSDDELAQAAARVGYPVLLKPSAGGGGKGMRAVHRAGDLADAIASARREARGAFGDDTLLVERLVTTPRHIEIQVLADDARQRDPPRRARVLPAAPAPEDRRGGAVAAARRPEQRAAMGAAACAAARACGYTGAGTVEFIVAGDRPDQCFFMEMNTRLQVEHPVTEEVTGLDLVELQLRVAAGEPLPLTQDDVVLRGHAIEARVYAEDPAAGLPAHRRPRAGAARAARPPGRPGRLGDRRGHRGRLGLRPDAGQGHRARRGPGRGAAPARRRAAAGPSCSGVGTNIGFLRALLADPDVRAGNLDTGLVGRRVGELATADLPDDVVGVATGIALLDLEPRGPVVDPFDVPGGWRVGEPAWTTRRVVAAGHDPVEVRSRGRAADAELVIDGGATLHGVAPPPTTGTPRAGSPAATPSPAATTGCCGCRGTAAAGRSASRRPWRRPRRRPRAPAARCSRRCPAP